MNQESSLRYNQPPKPTPQERAQDPAVKKNPEVVRRGVKAPRPPQPESEELLSPRKKDLLASSTKKDITYYELNPDPLNETYPEDFLDSEKSAREGSVDLPLTQENGPANSKKQDSYPPETQT